MPILRRIAELVRLLVLVGGAAWLAVLAGQHVQVMVMTERWLADFRIGTLLPPEPQHKDIVLVTVTEQTLEQFAYRSPVDRGFLADLLEIVEARGARAVLLDFLIDQPTEPDKDARLHETLLTSRVPLVISTGGLAEGLTPEQVAFLEAMVPERLRGLANLSKDPFDSTVRWIFPGRLDDSGIWRPSVIGRLVEHLGLPPLREPRRIAWKGRQDAATPAFARYPAHLLALMPADWVRDKIVLIGADLPMTDRHRTPFSTTPDGDTMAGVAIFAHALATVLEDRQLQSWSVDDAFRIALAVAVVGGLLALVPLPLPLRIVAAGALVVIGWAGAFELFRQTGILVPLLGPTLAFALATWGVDAALVHTERRRRAFLRRAFAQYVAPQVVRQIVSDPSRLTVHGERREMSFLFADIANFTQVSETMAPEALTRLMNEYLEMACRVIYRYEGTVCTFMGDGVFALFGAPIDQPDHARRAASCALDLAAEAEVFRQARIRDSQPFGQTRIGVHSGTAVAGNIGSTLRFQYTAIGDSVNTASRLEGLNKYFGTQVCVSADALPPDMAHRARPMGRIILRGRTQPVRVFELLPDPLPDPDIMAQYEQAYALLEDGKIEDAQAAFQALHDRAPDDAGTVFFTRRLKAGRTETLIRMREK